MGKASKKQYIIIKSESFLESVMSDIMTFVSMGALGWFNHQYMGSSWVYDALIVFSVIVLLTRMNTKNVMRISQSELRATLERLANETEEEARASA